MNSLSSAGIVAGQRVLPRASDITYQATAAVSGLSLAGDFAEATDSHIDAAASAAEEAFAILRSAPPEKLSALLSGIADSMLESRPKITDRCIAETGYLEARVDGEFDRAVMQLRLFSRLAADRIWDVRQIESADPTRTPLPKPEMRRRLMPVGPVVVMGACNFPLAISVVGNDTVAAFAVGCPVIVKSHPGHPGTCEILGRIVADVVDQLALPAGTFSLLHGRLPETAQRLVRHEKIASVGFTGSPTGGRALAAAVLDRPRPIPIFAELGSTNPVFLAADAMRNRLPNIASGFASSLRFGNGQMCTKPGVIVALKQQCGELIEKVVAEFEQQSPIPLLGSSIAVSFDGGCQKLRTSAEIESIFESKLNSSDGPFHRGPHWYAVDAADAMAGDWLHQETFGPVSLLVRCDDESEMLQVAESFSGSLTTTIHADEGDSDFRSAWLSRAERFGGRIILNGWPTGMEIGSATHHGGPYPASLDGRSTSVGFSSLERFIRPVCYQNWQSVI